MQVGGLACWLWFCTFLLCQQQQEDKKCRGHPLSPSKTNEISCFSLDLTNPNGFSLPTASDCETWDEFLFGFMPPPSSHLTLSISQPQYLKHKLIAPTYSNTKFWHPSQNLHLSVNRKSILFILNVNEFTALKICQFALSGNNYFKSAAEDCLETYHIILFFFWMSPAQ